MSTLQKVLMGLVGVAAITTLILPGRQTVPVLTAGGKLIQGTFGEAMGTTTGVAS